MNAIYFNDEFGGITLKDLMDNPSTDIVKKGNKISLRREVEDIGIVTVTIDQLSNTDGVIMTKTKIPSCEKKSDYLDSIIELKKKGYKQKDIAFKLNISESYITKLLKSAES